MTDCPEKETRPTIETEVTPKDWEEFWECGSCNGECDGTGEPPWVCNPAWYQPELPIDWGDL